MIHRIVDGYGFLNGYLVHNAPAPQQDPVGLTAPDLQPGGLLLLPRMVDGQRDQLEAVLLGENFQRRNGFLAIRAIVIYQGDLLALQLVYTPLLLADILHKGRHLTPISRGKVKGPFEHPAIGRSRAAISHRMNRDFIDWRLGNELIGNPGAVRIDQRGARWPLVFQLFVTFNAKLGIVLRLTLFPRDLDAVDTTVTRVEQLEIVDIAVGNRDAIRGIGSRTVHEQGNKELILGQPWGGADEPDQHGEADSHPQSLRVLHSLLPLSGYAG